MYRPDDHYRVDIVLDEREHIAIDPSVQGGEPCLSANRLTCEHMATVWWHGGWSLADMLDNWPGLTETGVMLACWYVARYGRRTWRKRWEGWLQEYRAELSRGDYDKVPLPPQKEAQQ